MKYEITTNTESVGFIALFGSSLLLQSLASLRVSRISSAEPLSDTPRISKYVFLAHIAMLHSISNITLHYYIYIMMASSAFIRATLEAVASFLPFGPCGHSFLYYSPSFCLLPTTSSFSSCHSFAEEIRLAIKHGQSQNISITKRTL
jgi:hypothetical protein